MSVIFAYSNYKNETQEAAVWVNPVFKKRPFGACFMGALGMHLVLFLIGGFVFNHAPEYGMELSRGGIDVELIAAPAAGHVVLPDASQPQLKSIVKSEIEIPLTKPVLKTQLDSAPMSVPSNLKATGDGSSSRAGEDKTTLFSSGSGQASEKPGYLKNPPPSYPSEAIRKGQEGLVTLSVWVDPRGQVQKIEVEQSSGFSSLDRSALKAVGKWEFSPGRIGTIATESHVTIPVRFRLKDTKGLRS